MDAGYPQLARGSGPRPPPSLEGLLVASDEQIRRLSAARELLRARLEEEQSANISLRRDNAALRSQLLASGLPLLSPNEGGEGEEGKYSVGVCRCGAMEERLASIGAAYGVPLAVVRQMSALDAEVDRLFRGTVALRASVAEAQQQRDESVRHLVALDGAVRSLQSELAARLDTGGTAKAHAHVHVVVGNDSDPQPQTAPEAALLAASNTFASLDIPLPRVADVFLHGSGAEVSLGGADMARRVAGREAAIAEMLRASCAVMQSQRAAAEALEASLADALRDVTTAAETTAAAMDMMDAFRSDAEAVRLLLRRRCADDLNDALFLEERMRSQIVDRAVGGFYSLVATSFYPPLMAALSARTSEAGDCAVLREDLAAAIGASEQLSGINRQLAEESSRLASAVAAREEALLRLREQGREADDEIASLRSQLDGASLRHAVLREQVSDLTERLRAEEAECSRLRGCAATEKAAAAARLATVEERLDALAASCEAETGALVTQLEAKELAAAGLHAQIADLQRDILGIVSTPRRPIAVARDCDPHGSAEQADR